MDWFFLIVLIVVIAALLDHKDPLALLDKLSEIGKNVFGQPAASPTPSPT